MMHPSDMASPPVLSKVPLKHSKPPKTPEQKNPKLSEDKYHHQIAPWAKKNSIPQLLQSYFIWKLREASFLKVTRRVSYHHFAKIYGTPKTSVWRVILKSLPTLGSQTPSEILEEVEKCRQEKIKVIGVMENIEIDPPDSKNHLTKYEEALVVSKSDMEDTHSVGITRYHIGKSP